MKQIKLPYLQSYEYLVNNLDASYDYINIYQPSIYLLSTGLAQYEFNIEI